MQLISQYLDKLKTIELQNSLGLLIDKSFKFSNSLIFLFITKYIGLKYFANLGYVLSLIFFFTIHFESGIKEVFIREYHSNKIDRDKLFFNTLVIGLCSTILFYILVAIYSVFEENKIILTLIHVLSIGYILKPFIVYKYIIEAELKLLKLIIRLSPIYIIGFLAKILCIFLYNKQPLYLLKTICLIISIENLAECIVVSTFHFKFNLYLKRLFSKMVIQKIILDSLPLLVSALMISLYVRIDQIIKRFLTNENELALYSFAVRLVEISYTLTVAFIASQFPSFIHTFNKGEDIETKVLLLVKKNLKINFYISLIVFLLSVAICEYTYSNSGLFYKSIILIGFLLLINIFIVIGSISSYYLIVKNLRKVRLLSTFFGVISNIIVVAILVPFLGAWGAVMASLISYGIAGLGYMFFFKSTSILRKKIIDSIL